METDEFVYPRQRELDVVDAYKVEAHKKNHLVWRIKFTIPHAEDLILKHTYING